MYGSECKISLTGAEAPFPRYKIWLRYSREPVSQPASREPASQPTSRERASERVQKMYALKDSVGDRAARKPAAGFFNQSRQPARLGQKKRGPSDALCGPSFCWDGTDPKSGLLLARRPPQRSRIPRGKQRPRRMPAGLRWH